MGASGSAVNLTLNSPVRLATCGVVLREWAEGDAQSMVDLFEDPEIALHTPLPSPFTIADAKERLVRAKQPDRLLLAVTTDGERPLGEVLLTASGELGYVIGASHRRQGLAVQALRLLRDYAHESLGVAVVRLRIEPGNHPSAVTAQKAGFQRAGVPAELVENKERSYTVDVWKHERR